MNLHQRFNRVNDELDALQKEVWRVVLLSENKMAVCYYNQADRQIETKVIDATNALEVSLISLLTGEELLAFAGFMISIESWCSSATAGDFPIRQDDVALASYRTLLAATVQPE